MLSHNLSEAHVRPSGARCTAQTGLRNLPNLCQHNLTVRPPESPCTLELRESIQFRTWAFGLRGASSAASPSSVWLHFMVRPSSAFLRGVGRSRECATVVCCPARARTLGSCARSPARGEKTKLRSRGTATNAACTKRRRGCFGCIGSTERKPVRRQVDG